MRCEVCGFPDPRRYSHLSLLVWVDDGIPLYTFKAVCAECGWKQAIWQDWVEAAA